jgi:hypothetical protein
VQTASCLRIFRFYLVVIICVLEDSRILDTVTKPVGKISRISRRDPLLCVEVPKGPSGCSGLATVAQTGVAKTYTRDRGCSSSDVALYKPFRL